MESSSRCASPLVTPEILRAELRRQEIRIGAMFVAATGILLTAMAIGAGAVIQAMGG